MDQTTCPGCGAEWQDMQTCQHAFHQFLFWENEGDEDDWSVHHLMVICYHMQHPQIISMDWLKHAKAMLMDFVEKGISPQEMRRKNQAFVSSRNRKWKIKASDENYGFYQFPIRWTMTSKEVLLDGQDAYPVSVKKWALSIVNDMRKSKNVEDETTDV